MSEGILVTAAKENTASLFSDSAHRERFLHLPLEMYVPRQANEEIQETLHHLNDFDQIVYASEHHARCFISQLQHFDVLEAARQRLNIVYDKPAFNFLESQGMAAVHPQNGSKAIDVVELMLRLKRLGPTLYPCGADRREDLPGLLQELDIPVTELDLFDLEGPTEEQLATYRQKLSTAEPRAVVFHSRRSVTRTLAAFPSLDYRALHVASADTGITQKLEAKDITVDKQADGSWASILNLVEKW